jgi:glutamate-ammonia-ligase adenylyltransferase
MVARLSALKNGPIPELLGSAETAAESLRPAPYLSNLLRLYPDVLDILRTEGPDAAVRLSLDMINKAFKTSQDREFVSTTLRKAKAKGHLAIALADLAGLWSVAQVTRAITILAEKATEAALWCAYNQARERGWVVERDSVDEIGIFAIAMGKMGAYELNYSSDVDLIVFFDPEKFETLTRSKKEAAVKITQDFSRLMEERDEHGYVFRVDLRLRPDPSSNAVAVSTETALNYYERVGQNWERMAFIKSRICAGDKQAGQSFMTCLEPFIWRRHLDYWAIGDIHAIKRQIHSVGGHAQISEKEFDVKLGRGGIREIEFFAQTQQLILGGRNPELRFRGTFDALDALVGFDAVDPNVAEDLKTAYDFLRVLEHRIQMRNDEQTHLLPDREDSRLKIAALSGYSDDLEAFEKDIIEVRRFIHSVYADLFAQEDRLSGDDGNLVFTGVDDDPGTVSTLIDMGFSNPSDIIQRLRQWHRGGLPATRSARGQQLLTTLMPNLLKWMADTGEADAAFTRFSDFITQLRGGVQVFSLMLAEPAFAKDLISVMAYAPKLARYLAQRPALLDCMLEPDFTQSLSGDDEARAMNALKDAVSLAPSFEDKLNAARLVHREENLRIGYQVLQGQSKADAAGPAYSRLADASITLMADAALQEVQRKFGDWSGKWVIGAFGKLGGQELSATSDLDIIVIYDPGTPPDPNDLATRFTQRLIAALSAPTEEGELYEVDMQLRPSGKAGPVAVKISSFEKYYKSEAWTWEFMALTRMRVVAGDPALAKHVEDIKLKALQSRSSYRDLELDICNMRQRLAKERPAFGLWDLKLTPGGLLDIEFVVQQLILKHVESLPEVLNSNTLKAITLLEDHKLIDETMSRDLQGAYVLQSNLQQALRIATSGKFEPDRASDGMKTWIAQTVSETDFASLTDHLAQCQSGVARIREKIIGPLATEN